jgi:hypothetical protein
MNVTESGFKNRQLHIEDYLQMVSAEQKEYAEVFDYRKITEKSGVITDYWTDNLLDLILRKDNLNEAYRRVKSNKGAGGIDGMQVDGLLPYLRENQETLIQEIRNGKFKANPVQKTGSADRGRPGNTAGSHAGTHAYLRGAVLGEQLWFSTKKRSAQRTQTMSEKCQRWLCICGRYGLGKVL